MVRLVNKETNGIVGTGTETYSIGHITGTGLILNGDLDVDGHTNLDNVSVAGVSTFSIKCYKLKWKRFISMTLMVY